MYAFLTHLSSQIASSLFRVLRSLSFVQMRFLTILASLFALGATVSYARSSTGDRVLVLREAETGVEEYQLFWDSLQGERFGSFASAR